jgi:hypothetical protein
MDMHRSEQLKQIIELSQQMLKQARAMEWDRVAELEVQRKQLVMKCFQRLSSEQEAQEVATCIQQILRLNDEITVLGRDFKTQLSGELHTHKLGRAASAAYRSCAR